ncbi:MAG TPA: hypothetical protein VER83_09840 [Candidatus Nanopelagicales bacterium]|nr:hypothetical protein [Candidatus Nanopelagicales bacterium]
MRPRPHALLLAAGLAFVVAACGGSGTPTQPTSPTLAPTPPRPTDVPGGGDRTPAPSPGTFEIAWGTAWDALPPGFPVPPDATPADPGDPADGPVSGAFVADGAPDDVARAMQTGLGTAGYSTEALSGPFEDGSLVIDSVGLDPACRVQTRVRELGGTTMITVLFGASCPWS